MELEGISNKSYFAMKIFLQFFEFILNLSFFDVLMTFGPKAGSLAKKKCLKVRPKVSIKLYRSSPVSLLLLQHLFLVMVFRYSMSVCAQIELHLNHSSILLNAFVLQLHPHIFLPFEID